MNQEDSEGLGSRTYDGSERKERGVEIMRVGKRFGLGNTFLGMCCIKIRGHQLSSLQKQGIEGVGGQWGSPILRKTAITRLHAEEKGTEGLEIRIFFKVKFSDF